MLLRQAFEGLVDAALAAANHTTSLLLVDLDHFKAVNDVFGHPVGDSALRHVAELVAAGARRATGSVGRLCGDELGVLVIGCSQETALDRARELVVAVRDTPLRTESGQQIALTVSIGVASCRTGPRAELYALADVALHNAKRTGRDRASSGPGDDRRSISAH